MLNGFSKIATPLKASQKDFSANCEATEEETSRKTNAAHPYPKYVRRESALGRFISAASSVWHDLKIRKVTLDCRKDRSHTETFQSSGKKVNKAHPGRLDEIGVLQIACESNHHSTRLSSSDQLFKEGLPRGEGILPLSMDVTGEKL